MDIKVNGSVEILNISDVRNRERSKSREIETLNKRFCVYSSILTAGFLQSEVKHDCRAFAHS